MKQIIFKKKQNSVLGNDKIISSVDKREQPDALKILRGAKRFFVAKYPFVVIFAQHPIYFASIPLYHQSKLRKKMKQIFINLPVKNVEASMGFYTQLGFTINPLFTFDDQKCMVWSEQIYVMLQTYENVQIGEQKKDA